MLTSTYLCYSLISMIISYIQHSTFNTQHSTLSCPASAEPESRLSGSIPDDTVMSVDGLAIDASHLARRYGRRWALAGVSFQLARGQVMMVAGRNGSGKTTLLRILSTAIRADGGRALVAGYDLEQREEIRRQTALLAHYS